MRYVLWTLFAVAACVVVYFSVQPGPSGSVFTWWDKFQHFAAYFALSVLAGSAARSWRQALLFAVILASAGYAMEWVQLFVGRSYDLADALANALGCLAGFAASRAFAAIAPAPRR